MKLSLICRLTGAEAPREDVEITRITTDSRKAGAGDLFIAIRGVRTDGHDYIDEVIKKGVAAVASEREVPGAGVPVVVTDSTRKFVSRAYSAWYGGDEACRPHKTRLVAVTGTNGKTTITHMMRDILSNAGYKVGVIGTVGASLGERGYGSAYPMTTPSPDEFYSFLWDMIRNGADYIVFEASSHGISQERLAGLDMLGCEMSAAIFTNLTPEHLDYHADMEDYFYVKSRLFTEFSPKISIINTSDEYGRRLISMCGEGAVAVDTEGDGGQPGSVYPHSVVMAGTSGVEYMYTSPRAIFPIACPVPGRYTVYNSIEAAACAVELGIDPVTVREALGVFGGVRGRMERVRCDKTKFSPPVLIDFAHTPAALEGLMLSVRELEPTKRLVLLFGCGGDRDRTKRPVMGGIAARTADFTIVTSDNSRTERPEDIISEILAGIPEGTPHTTIVKRAEAIEYAIMNATPNDVIILAGKGHESYEDVGGVRRDFDERAYVMAAVEKRYAVKGEGI